MANEQQLRQALIKADAAGDFEAAKLFASKIKEIKGVQSVDTNSDLVIPSNNGLPQQQVEPVEEKSFLDTVGEFFTGSDRETKQL